MTQTAAAAAAYEFATTPGRLPKDVVPDSYEVALRPDAQSLTVSGSETVHLRVLNATAALLFNSLHQTLRNVRFDGKPVAGVNSDDARQMTTVTLRRAAPAGAHTLSFDYAGHIESEPRGLFRQNFRDDAGGEGMLLSTQMEATDARRMFPCWDEPAFRARFRLTVSVPEAWTALSNMPVERRSVAHGIATVHFATTPAMPSYLIEFTAGALREVDVQSGATRLAVWAIAGHEQDGRIALANAAQILSDYNEYFGIPFPLPKLDSIAIPGGFNGAMENWGAITYNDQVLLLGASSTIRNRQTVYDIQAHEMAHQWFGDLVTMAWWDEIWLNESFASWRGVKETDARNPTWKWWEHEDDTKETAMRADARPSSHSIEQHVTDELQAINAFDPEITYNKGQAMLRMLEAYLGEDVFRDGIRRYMKARAYSNATSADLWNALASASGRNVAEIAGDWTDKPGFPLVMVQSSCDASGARALRLTQKRFLLNGADGEVSHWRVPLRIRSGAAPPRSVLLERDGQQVEAGRCDETLSVNADAIGYFRTDYDPATLAVDTRRFGTVPDADRIALLDDQWALVEVGSAPLESFLALAGSMGVDTDTRAWQQILAALDTLEYDERGTPGHDAFAAYARALVAPLAARLGWDANADETPDTRELRRTLLADLGKWGDAGTIAEARKRFAAFIADRATLPANDQALVLGIVARNADAGTFQALHRIAQQAKNQTELERYYRSLATVRDPQLALQVRDIALSDEIPAQATLLRLTLVLVLAGEHPALSWETFSANQARLLASMTMSAPLLLAQSVPGVYWDAVPPAELDAWVRAHVPAEMADAVARGMETARFKVREKAALVPAADAVAARTGASRR